MKSAAKLLLVALVVSAILFDIGALGALCGASLSCGMPHRSSSTLAWWLMGAVASSLLLSSALTSGRVRDWLARYARACASRLIDWLHSPGSRRSSSSGPTDAHPSDDLTDPGGDE